MRTLAGFLTDKSLDDVGKCRVREQIEYVKGAFMEAVDS